MSLLDKLKRLASLDGNGQPDEAHAGDARDVPDDAGTGRRLREAGSAESELRDVVAAKVLHGWLQNRHQTAFPLAANVGRRPPGEQEALAGFAAVAALSAGDPAAAGERVSAWLRSSGAGEAALAAFAAAAASPPRLHDALRAVAGRELSGLALIAAIVAGGRAPEPAARLFADYVAARLDVPSAAVRAAERRFGS